MKQAFLSVEQKEQYLKDLKRDFLLQVITGIKKGELSRADASDLAKAFQASIVKEVEEMLTQICSLGRDYKQAQALCAKYGKAYDEEKRMYLLERAHAYLQKGEVEYALLALKGEIIYG